MNAPIAVTSLGREGFFESWRGKDREEGIFEGELPNPAKTIFFPSSRSSNLGQSVHTLSNYLVDFIEIVNLKKNEQSICVDTKKNEENDGEKLGKILSYKVIWMSRGRRESGRRISRNQKSPKTIIY